MRALLWIATLLLVLWSGYWFIGKSAVERGFAGFLAQAPARGLDVSQAGYTVAGYPNRFDLTVTEPRLKDQRSEIAWEAPFVQIFSLSYKPWHVIAAFAQQQTIRTPAEDLTLDAGKLQASVVVTPNRSLAIDRSTVVGDALRLGSSLGWTVMADQLRLASRVDPSQSNAHVLGMEVLGLTPDPALAARLPDLPPQIERLRLDATARLSAPLDRFAAQTRPALTGLSLREGLISWGDLSVFAKGELTVIDDMPDGRIDIRVTGWRSLVTASVSMGMISPDIAPTVSGMMQALALRSGDPNTLELPVIFTQGRVMLGPLPLGPAPRLR